MQRSTTLEVRKHALADTRLSERDLPTLGGGEVLAKVDRFALTANNVTYGVVGEKIGYWRFFPAADGWGVIPVWGFADVVESRHPDVPAGERLYGYFPMGTHLVMRPAGVKRERLVDGASHRTALPPAVALTSRKNLAWVSGLGLYSGVYDYDNLDAIDAATPTVIVDMSGNGTVLSALHARLGDTMRHCANVGITHYEETAMGPGFIAERSAMFFAPAHIQKRTTEWGPGVFQRKAFEFWRQAAVRSRAWLRLERFAGLDGLQTAYQRVLGGEISPDRGVIVDLQGSG